MVIKKLVSSSHPMLKRQAQPVTTFDDTLTQLLQDIEDTMYEYEAAGLCAPQIGTSLQVAMIDMEADGLLQLINPKVVSQSEATVTDLEGSVTNPNVFGPVTRSKMIVVQCQDVHGQDVELTAHDDVARMILHIIDQLNGIEFTEKATKLLSEEEVEAYFND